MKRSFFQAVLAAVFVVGLGGPVKAGFFVNNLVNHVDNTLEDQSREAYVDANNDGAFDAGDVLAGFVRIDDMSTATTGVSAKQHVYAVFTQQVQSVSVLFDDGTTDGHLGGSPVLATVKFEATTLSGFTLGDLIGTSAPAGAVVALFDEKTASGFPVNLIDNSPGNLTGSSTVNMFDYLKSITNNGNLQLIAGFGSTAVGNSQADDYFKATITSATGLGLAFDSTGVGLIPNSIDIASYNGGLSVLVNPNAPNVTYAEVVAASNGTLHDLVISGGTVKGEGGLPNSAEWDNTNPDSNLNNPGGFADKGDFTLHPNIVPEPATFCMFAGSLLILGAGSFSRRLRKVSKD